MNYFQRLTGLRTAILSIATYAVLFSASGMIYAQTDAKRELATKVASLQQGPEMDRMLQQLARASTEPLVANWAPRLQTMQPAKQKQVSESLNAELKKFDQDALKIFSGKVSKVSTDNLVGAYMEKFSEDELKQLVSLLEAPVFKKYQSASPELGNLFVQKLIDASRPELEARAKTFDTAAGKLVGTNESSGGTPAASPTTPAPAPAPAPAGSAPKKK
jgi:uncharacterized protein